MAIRRNFLGLSQPALTVATEFLFDSVGSSGPIDLSNTVVVVPGARAGRRLRSRMLYEANQRNRGLLPPQIVTVSYLPELLYQPKRPFASPWVQHLAWSTALLRCGHSIRVEIAPALAEREAESSAEAEVNEGWLDVGRMLWRQYRELTAEGLSFADVAERGVDLDGFFESKRWQALAAVQNEYLRALDREAIWDQQTARLVAVRHHECTFDGHIVLLGTVDLNRTIRLMLDQISDKVTSLVYAPTAWSDRFDEYGCVCPDAWEEADIDIADDQWSVVYGPHEQGQRITEIIQDYEGRFATSEVVIGCADAKLVPFVQRSLSERGVPSRWSGGVPIERSAPVKLLAELADLFDGMRFTRFCAWIRHPDVSRWLATKRVFPVNKVDKYFNHFLPATWTEPARGSRDEWEQAHLALEHTRTLLSSLREAKLPVTAWMPRVRKVFEAIYGAQTADLSEYHDRVKQDACQVIDDAIAGLAAMPASFALEITATQALRLIIAAVLGERLAAPPTDEAVELLGWLDLVLDEAPATIVTGVNEGVVPQSVTSDLFLPDRLRQHLQINDNRLRYARDAYAMSVLLGSRSAMHLITCQNDVHTDPLVPSRLLFCCDDETRVQRWLHFSNAVTGAMDAAVPSPPAPTDVAAHSLFETPLPDPEAELPTALSVTAFKSYLQCRYLFYLERILKLSFVDDDARELAGNRFGTLLHDALARFGRSPAKSLTDSSEIYNAVSLELKACFAEVCGEAPLAAVSVQFEQALLRLKAFAKVQAGLRQEGWEIEYVESENKKTVVDWVVDDEPFQIQGIVDRIDVHADTGAVRVIDYKTGDMGVKIKELWSAEGGWTDLQLPLYRHLAQQLGFAGPYEAAYFVLPKRCEDTQLLPAQPWTDEALQQADAQARDIIRRIRQRDFWPPAEERPQFSRDWDDVVGVKVMS